MIRLRRLPFVLLAILSLITGLLAGLQRLGWSIPLDNIHPGHGAIMVGGFLGSLIILEKIIPLKKKILYLLPAVSSGSTLFFYTGRPVWSVTLLLIASTGLGIVFLIYLIKSPTLVYVMMFAGAICWFTGNAILIRSNFYPAALPWWMSFVLLVITSERLELMKFLPVPHTQKLVFAGMLTLFLIGCLFSFHGTGGVFATFSLTGASLWLMRYDAVGINLKKEGLSRYVGVSLLSGYFALLLSGIFLYSLRDHAFGYDILIHSFFLGFVFSMIFAHGPIILPGVLGISVKPYHRILYVWIAMLHVSWVVRTVADIAFEMQVRKLSGVFSVVAIVGYFVSLATITFRTLRAKAL